MGMGCGGSFGFDPEYDFTGAWKGTLSNQESPCSDGIKFPAQSTQATIEIRAFGGGQLYWEAACGTVHLTQNGNIAAQVGTTTCPPEFIDGAQVTRSFHDASLVLAGNALQLDVYSDLKVSINGVTKGCTNIHASGTFVR
jgi:hypothetical protein